MNIVTQYIQKFMSESVVRPAPDPVAVEMDKIRDLIDLDEGSEFSIYVRFKEEKPSSIDPQSGALISINIDEKMDGYLAIEKENDEWSWMTSIPDSTVDLDGSGKGFSSLEECIQNIYAYASDFDMFQVVERI